MYFGGVARHDGAGVGAVLFPLRNMSLHTQLCSNNLVEYQALLFSFQMAIEIGIKYHDIYGDLQLVIKLLLEEYEVKKDDLMSYRKDALWLLDKHETVKLEHILRSANKISRGFDRRRESQSSTCIIGGSR